METIYFVRTPDGRIKVGVSGNIRQRLTTYGARAEVLACVPGDRLTEAEIHWRLREHALGGEYFAPRSALLDLAKDTAASGEVPGAWYVPFGWDRERRGSRTVPLLHLVTLTERAAVVAASGLHPATLDGARSQGAPVTLVPALFHAIRSVHPSLTLMDLYLGERPRAWGWAVLSADRQDRAA